MKKIAIVLMLLLLMNSFSYANEMNDEVTFKNYGWKFDANGELFDINSEKQSYGSVSVNFTQEKETFIGQPIIIGIGITKTEKIEIELEVEKGELEPLYPIWERETKRGFSNSFTNEPEYKSGNVAHTNDFYHVLEYLKWRKNDLIKENKINYVKEKDISQSETYFSFIPTEEGIINININIKLEDKTITEEIHQLEVKKGKSDKKVSLLTNGNEIIAFTIGRTQPMIKDVNFNELDIGFWEVKEHSNNIKILENKSSNELKNDTSSKVLNRQIEHYLKMREINPENNVESHQKLSLSYLVAELTEEITPNLEAGVILRGTNNYKINNIHVMAVYPTFQAQVVYIENNKFIPNKITNPDNSPNNPHNNTPKKGLPNGLFPLIPIILIPPIFFLIKPEISLLEDNKEKYRYVTYKGGLRHEVYVDIVLVENGHENVLKTIIVPRNNKIILEGLEDKHIKIKARKMNEDGTYKYFINYSKYTELKGKE